MPIFNISKNGDLIQISEKNFLLEKDIQKIVEKNIDTIFGLKFIASEYIHLIALDLIHWLLMKNNLIYIINLFQI